MLTWQYLPFSEINSLLIYKILALRCEVFVVEQACAYQDIDDLDQDAIHLMGWQEDKLVAYLRILTLTPQSIAIGRVIVKADARGHKFGDELLEQGLNCCHKTCPGKRIHISAQRHLTHFYQLHGFQVVGEPYLEDGIPHMGMDWHHNHLTLP